MDRNKCDEIARNIYIAYRKYVENSEPVIIMAEDYKTARRDANKHFGLSEQSKDTFIALHQITRLNNPSAPDANIFTLI